MYKTTTAGLVIREIDDAHIPKVHGNADFHEYLNWIEEGNTPTTLDETPKLADIDAQRAAAYRAESDPLYFKWQRGESTQQDWLASVQAIKERYPKPE